MMNGMDMMLKSMGLDKDLIEKQLGTFQQTAVNTVQHFDQRLSAVEAKCDSCVSLLFLIATKLDVDSEQLRIALSKAHTSQIAVTHG